MTHQDDIARPSVIQSDGFSEHTGGSATVVHPNLPGWAVTVTTAPQGAVVSVCIAPITCFQTPFGDDNYAPDAFWPLATIPATFEVTTRLLRRIPLGSIVGAIRSQAKRDSLSGTIAEDDETAARAERHREQSRALSSAIEAKQRPGRAGHGELFYAQLAAEYIALLDALDATPVATLARQRNYSRQRVADLLSKARDRRLLTQTSRGRAGGQLTDKANDILRGK